MYWGNFDKWRPGHYPFPEWGAQGDVPTLDEFAWGGTSNRVGTSPCGCPGPVFTKGENYDIYPKTLTIRSSDVGLRRQYRILLVQPWRGQQRPCSCVSKQAGRDKQNKDAINRLCWLMGSL